MNSDEIEADKRLALLERDVEELREMKTYVVQTREKVFEISIQVAALSKSACPSPGKCLELERAIADVSGRVKTVEITAAEARGGWKVVALISSIVGGVLTYVAEKLL